MNSLPGFLTALAALAACTSTPPELQTERDRAAAAGAAYRRPFGERELPPLAATSSLADCIAYAERANGELEAAWQRWQAALERVPQASAQASGAMLGAQQTLDGGAALDRTTFTLMSDAMNNLMFPGKLRARGEAALAEARVAAAAFDAGRLQLQTMVSERYLLLAQRDADLQLLQRLRATLAVALPSVQARVNSGGASQVELLRAQAAIDRVDAELAELRTGRPALLAALRAVLGADSDYRDASPSLPELQPLQLREQDAIAAALQHNPALQQAGAETEAALQRQRLAEWQRIPEFSLQAMLMGTGIWTLGGAVSLPFTRSTAINASLREAEALRAAAVAMQRQAGSDAVAAAIAERARLSAIEQQAEVLQQRLLPRLVQIAALTRAEWIAGSGEFTACSDATAMAIDVERVLLRLCTEHGIGRVRLQQAMGTLLFTP